MEVFAALRLYNPTPWTGAFIVEVPVGRIASPGLVDWGAVTLRAEGAEIPFGIREGRAHWRATLTAPVRSPRAEDLLVFLHAVAPGAWSRVTMGHGSRPGEGRVARDARALRVTHDELEITLDDSTGLVASARWAGRELLAGPLTLSAHAAEPERLASARQYFPSDTEPGYALGIGERLGDPPRARRASMSSTPAMTELSYVLTWGRRLSLALTYRVHAGGVLDIVVDERPGAGSSPWTDHAVVFDLRWAGSVQRLPYHVNRPPFYGFKEYYAAVRHIGEVVAAQGHACVVLGEETLNGRRWWRRAHMARVSGRADVEALVSAATEGLVVEIEPYRAPWSRGAVLVHDPAYRAAAATLAEGLRAAGLEPAPAEQDAARRAPAIEMRLERSPRKHGIEGDGFIVRSARKGIVIRAGTHFGLTQAAHRIRECLAAAEGAGGFPLVASNPVVELRTGGFGGADHEVDFPWDDDEEWIRVLDGMVDSGMNAMAALGMWGNWRMPVSYRYMPEIRADTPDAYDESSGARLKDYPAERDHGLKLLRYLQDRGVKVWLWIPIGCIPTTFARAYPEAMAEGNDKIPDYTHPEYRRYLDAFFRELLEEYPIDGLVLIRDDNGGICDNERCRAYLAGSRTRDPVWEQYLIIYDLVRGLGFRGKLAVYPYNDLYQPHLERHLPRDLFVVGHGSGLGVLTRGYADLGPMGDTWLDNLYGDFRVPSTHRMRRLLADRPSFWIGGAYVGMELPWEAIGVFGWEPTATVSTHRYRWGRRELGPERAVDLVALSEAYERLWDIHCASLLPITWIRLSPEERLAVGAEARVWLDRFEERHAALSRALGEAGLARHAKWLSHLRLWAVYFRYHLRRLVTLDEMRAVLERNPAVIVGSAALPEHERQALLTRRAAIHADAERYRAAAATVPSRMIRRTLDAGMMEPFGTHALGAYGHYLDAALRPPQFAGVLRAEAAHQGADGTTVLDVEMVNTGFWPWAPEDGPWLRLSGAAAALGLPERWRYEGPPLVAGERRTVRLRGEAPKYPGATEPGAASVRLELYPPWESRTPFAQTVAAVVGQ